MKKIKIGLLPLYIKLYDDVNVKKDGLIKFYDRVAEEFENSGLSVIKAPMCRIKSEFDKAVKDFETAGVDVIVTLHLAYSPSLESIDALVNTKLPIVVLDSTEGYGYGNEYSESPLMYNHGIHGVMDMCNLLKRRGKKYAICAGHIKDGKVIKRAADCIRAAVAAKSLYGSRTGVFGTSFKGMGVFLVSDDGGKDAFGIELVRFRDKEMKTALDSVSEKEITEERINYNAEFNICGDINEENIKTSIKSCLAVRKAIKEKNLDAFTVNFLDITKSNLGNMPFIECCKEMANGVGYAGEGDTLTASFVGAVAKVFKDFSFVEIFCPDWKENRLFISHMGEMNYAVAKSKPVLTEVGFSYTDAEFCYKGLAEFKSGQAVFCNVFKDKGEEFKLLLSDIEMINVDTHDFDDSMRGWFVPPVPVPEFLEKLSENGATHHSFIVYDVDIKALEYFGELLNLKVVKI